MGPCYIMLVSKDSIDFFTKLGKYARITHKEATVAN